MESTLEKYKISFLVRLKHLHQPLPISRPQVTAHELHARFRLNLVRQAYIKFCRGSFPGGKARPGRDADRSPPSSAEVKKIRGYTSSHPKRLSWRVASQLYFTLLYIIILVQYYLF
jgi:hypothetical protein